MNDERSKRVASLLYFRLALDVELGSAADRVDTQSRALPVFFAARQKTQSGTAKTTQD